MKLQYIINYSIQVAYVFKSSECLGVLEAC